MDCPINYFKEWGYLLQLNKWLKRYADLKYVVLKFKMAVIYTPMGQKFAMGTS